MFIGLVECETVFTIKRNKIDPVILQFLKREKFDSVLENFIKQSKTDQQFRTNILRWFNGIRMLKLVHFIRDQSLPNIPINEAVTQFWETTFNEPLVLTNKEWLTRFRQLEKA